jgi:uncharacterized membrane protein YgcG
MERVYDAWFTLCLPAKIYPIVMSGIILFDMYRGVYMRGISNIISMIVGTALLWVLCAAKMEFVAYGLLLLPVLFVVFLLAILVFDQSLLSITHDYKDGSSGRGRRGSGSGSGSGGSSSGSGGSSSRTNHSCHEPPSCIHDSCSQSC